MTSGLTGLHEEIKTEASRILNWWRRYAPDTVHGGFFGEVDQFNHPNQMADKGSVLHARMLWTFSAAYRKFGNEQDLILAQRAFEYLLTYFYDQTYSGVYWSLTYTGQIKHDRKQIYAIAFAIYGFSEYYKITGDIKALDAAISLYQSIENYSRDFEYGGYLEAFTRDWKSIDDLRLSEKDRNDPKTMNTHLHIIEAYSNLYLIWKEPHLKQAIIDLLDIFDKHIIHSSNHLSLFFDKVWNSTSSGISYGHDIEAAWLLQECAHIVQDTSIEKKWETKSIQMALASAEGLQPDGSLLHESDPVHHHTDRHREWWVSAEAMVGFLNAYVLTKDQAYLEKVYRIWNFIKTYLLDMESGEWYWGVTDDYLKMQEYKMGFWKCPYHNVRACLEVMERIEKLL
jgi:cellobiose epimerase